LGGTGVNERLVYMSLLTELGAFLALYL
jgi:hypothetical protein